MVSRNRVKKIDKGVSKWRMDWNCMDL